MGRSEKYQTFYLVGTLRGKRVYWHPNGEGNGFAVEEDHSDLVELKSTDGVYFTAWPVSLTFGRARVVVPPLVEPRTDDFPPDYLESSEHVFDDGPDYREHPFARLSKNVALGGGGW